MKEYLTFLTAAISATSTNASLIRRAQATSGSVHVVGACTYDNVVSAYDVVFPGAGLSTLTTQLGNPADVAGAVNLLCAGAEPGSSVDFDEASGNGYQFDFNYYAGGTSFNNGGEEPLAIDAARVLRYWENKGHSAPLEFPTHIDMFDSCELHAAMCCFTNVRSDGAGSDLTSTVDDGMLANAEICTVDQNLNPTMTHVKSGHSVYNAKSTDRNYCTGFAWESDATSVSNTFAGNTLLYVSMIDSLVGKNYVKSVPGAPLCGCVEKMPQVTKADCVQAWEGYSFDYDGSSLTVTYKLALEDCGTDLVSHYEASGFHSTEEVNSLKSYLVGDGNCVEAQDDFIASKYQLVRGGTNIFDTVDLEKWEPVYSRGLLEYYGPTPYATNDQFMALFNASPNKIVRRICKSCFKSHSDIYYKRLTTVPNNVTDFFSYFLTDWVEEQNILGTDFDLYSSYELALNETDYDKWRYCNYDYAGVGFPRDCGWFGYVGSNWNSIEKTWAYGYDVAFFVEK